MKKTILTLTGILCYLITNAQTQISVEALKKENSTLKTQISKFKQDTTYLHTVINTCNLLNKSHEFSVQNTNSKYTVEILNCIGDRNAQTVTITFMLSHSTPHQLFQLYSGTDAPTAFDNLGNAYQFKNIFLPNGLNSRGTTDCIIPTNIRVKASITFRNVMPYTEIFPLVRFDYSSVNQDRGANTNFDTYKVEIKNAKIQWQ